MSGIGVGELERPASDYADAIDEALRQTEYDLSDHDRQLLTELWHHFRKAD